MGDIFFLVDPGEEKEKEKGMILGFHSMAWMWMEVILNRIIPPHNVHTVKGHHTFASWSTYHVLILHVCCGL